MKEVYLDNAATTRYKPGSVVKAMKDYFRDIGCSPGRGGYEFSLDAGRILLEARLNLAQFFNVPTPEQIVFTHNITCSLNYAIKGLLQEGDHVITTTLEHNSVIRPLKSLESEGIIDVSYINADKRGLIQIEDINDEIKDNTKMIIITHASNVIGALLPIKEIAKIADLYNLFFVLDTAQTAGVYELNFSELSLDILAFTGHKGLMGPPGTGGFAISQRAAKQMKPLIEGGTGSISDKEYQPDFLPDKFESGTPNTPGIAGLNAGVEFIKQEGLGKIRSHKLKLTNKLLRGLKEIKKVNIHGSKDIKLQTATVSITVTDCDLGELSFTLDDKYNIMTRSGLHCAPLTHKTIGTFPEGTLRFSIGYFNTEEEIDYTLQCLEDVLK
ncbi:aminotransferase class V-fold PLP-dependent enzyme [Natroniella acetigena]|uniref:aminotransferase class V-fold PLP-dependent enzyme n=1 Tax=Natroniella acetigena TaxID=52004 RepID=UPI00200AC258|nr:aminotransferase class V-fold PLP-dependent enzyme [Natroniella acetigena]MCK8826776.1 aminotransferase class V-fold PLP-dependent enzyme [Natroniella acetigena]